MKKNSIMMLAMCASLALASTAFAQEAPPLTTVSGGTSADLSPRKKAGFDMDKAIAQAVAQQVGDATEVAIRLRWVKMTASNSPNAPAAYAKLAQDWLDGKLDMSHTATGPSDYYVHIGANGQISWDNALYSSNPNFHLWNGDENPPAPYNNEPGNVAQLVVEVTGINGNVWLSGLMSTASASYDPNIDQVQSLAGANYSLGAPGVKANGERVVSGSGTTRVKKFLVVIMPEMYLGNSHDGVTSVWTWLTQTHPDFWLGMRVEYRNASTLVQVASSKVSMVPLPTPVMPELTIVINGGNIHLRVPSGGAPGSRYLVVHKSTLTGQWESYGYVKNDGVGLAVPNSGATEFFALWSATIE